MKLNKICLAIGLLASNIAFATQFPVTIKNLDTKYDCMGDDIQIVQGNNGEYFIEAFFFDMDATIDGTDSLSEKKTCLMNYDLQLAPGYKLEVVDFSVDANYELSDSGSARLTVSHRVDNGPSARTTISKSARKGDPLFGDVHDLTGTIKRNQLGVSAQRCGASIPLKTTLQAQARMPSVDAGQITSITLDEGVSKNGFDFARIRCVPCS